MMVKNLEQIKELADQVKRSMDQLVNLTDQAINNLPPEERKNVAPIQQDIHGILDAVKKGDTMKIHEISKKYAGTNNQ